MESDDVSRCSMHERWLVHKLAIRTNVNVKNSSADTRGQDGEGECNNRRVHSQKKSSSVRVKES